MKRTLLAAGLMLMPLIAHSQQVLDCSSGNCKYVNPPSAASQSAAKSSATATARTTSRSTAQSGVAQGNTINAPVTTSSRATGGNAQGGSSNVVVVNRVSSGYGSGGGGFRRGAGSGGGGSAASDPPAATDPAATDPGPALGSSGNPLTENIGGTTTIRNVPEIVAPNISGGNPCLVGVSGGGAGPGIGITLGFGYSDKGCDRRNNAALLSNIGMKDAAVALMCQDDSVRRAFAESGHPCAADRPVAAAAPASTAAVDPAVIRREQEIPAPVPAPTPAPITIVTTSTAGNVKPAWCDTTSPQELRFHPECAK